jgi:hypothetical protein
MEVEHLTRTEMNQKIKSSLEEFRRPYLPQNRLEDDDVMKEASDMGYQVLNTLFGRQDRFNKNFLLNMGPDGEGSVQDELLAWFDEIDWPAGWKAESTTWCTTTTTPLQYQHVMQQLLRSGLWIFTNIVRYDFPFASMTPTNLKFSGSIGMLIFFAMA